MTYRSCSALWAAGLLTLALPAFGAITVSSWSPLFRGIDLATGNADALEERLQKVFALRVDLQDPAIEFFSTPGNGDGALETFGQTTTAFVNEHGLAIGVNANFFSPVTTIADDPRDLRGLAVSRGVVISPAEDAYPAAMITRSNQASFITVPSGGMGSVWTAVSGSHLVLIAGTPQLEDCQTTFCKINPRTALGLSQDRRYLYLMVVDGRQTGWSMGATLYETGQWLARFGAWDGLNLDGGGSSAMAFMTNGTAALLNRPSGGTQRINGNHLGVFADPALTAIWNGGGTDNLWSSSANWKENLPQPGTSCNLRFGGSTRLTPINNLPPGSDFRHLAFLDGAGPFALTGNAIRLNGSLTNHSTATQTINFPIIIASNLMASPAVGDIILDGPLSGAGFTVSGPGAVILSATNTYSGATTVSGGGLIISGSLSNHAGAVKIDNGALSVSGSLETGTGAWDAGATSGRGVLNFLAGARVLLNSTFRFGSAAGTSGAVNIAGGTVTNLQATASGNFAIGVSGYGAMNMSGGIIRANQFWVNGGTGIGVATISGGEFYCGTGSDYLLVGTSTGTGSLTVSGGRLSHAHANRLLSVNNSGNARGELNLLGGIIDNTGGGVGYGYNTGAGNGAGVVNINGGELKLNRFVNKKAEASGTTGISYLNLNGGTLTVTRSTLTSPGQAFSQNLLPPLTAVFLNGPFGSFSGGAVIDTAGQDCLVEAALQAPTGRGIIAVAMADGGAGYVGAPYVTINGDGAGATAIANMADDGSGRGTLKVESVTVCNPGVNYTYASFLFNGGAPSRYASSGGFTLAANTSGGLIKNGAGSLTLLGTNTYTGPTQINDGFLRVNGTLAGGAVTVAGGALGGNGVIGGWVNVQPGGALSPEGALSISNTLSLTPGSTTFVRINAETDGSDSAQGITTVHYGGELIVTNTAGALYQGQTFQVFNARAHTGNFSGIKSAGGEATWAFNPATGELAVQAVTSTIPTNISLVLKEANLALAWPGSHLGWLAQSNAVNVADAAQWHNIPGSELRSNLKIPISPAMEKVFYRLRTSRICDISKHFDEESATYYYLTRIFHQDKDGKLIKLRLAPSNKPEGETVRNFALRMNTALAFNASMGQDNLPPDIRRPVGIQIVDGKILQDLTTTRYTLGIRDNNELLACKPEKRAQYILNDGVHNALTAFIPLIENHEPVSEEILKTVGNSSVKHPRQVIAQFDNLDILFLSCGGRGYDGEGMTAKELIKVLKPLDVRFAFNLDGGGSVSVVVGDKLITKKIDGNGTKERLRPNFLYVLDN